jgi:hypothetical protein
MAYRIAEVCFVHPTLLPDGRFGQQLVETDRCRISRDGDILLVEYTSQDAVERGFPADVVREYNWNNVAWCIRAPEAPAKKK